MITATSRLLPPSVHVQGFVYRWTNFGGGAGSFVGMASKILLGSLKLVPQQGAVKQERAGEEKDPLWFLNFKGDLRSLDILGMLEALGHPAELINGDEDKYSVLCPWHENHAETERKDRQFYGNLEERGHVAGIQVSATPTVRSATLRGC